MKALKHWIAIRLLGAFAAAAAAGWASTAWACTVSEDYFALSNFELAQLADAIVVATPVRQEGPRENRLLTFRVESVLKGPAPAEFSSGMGHFGRATPSDPNNIAEPNSEAMMGACQRTTFARGGKYVVFLRRTESGGYDQLAQAFARINEDFTGEDSLWVRTLRAYLGIQTEHPLPARVEAMERLLAETRGQPQTPDRKALADDIRAYLASTSPFKPTSHLVAQYRALERGELPAYWEPVPELAAYRRPEEEKRRVLLALLNGDHAEGAPLFERFASSDARPAELGLAIRFFARHGQYRRAYALIETQALQALLSATREEAYALLRNISTAQGNDFEAPGDARWRSDPYTVAAWPELALKLETYRLRTFGPGGFLFDDALQAIKLDSHRARPDLTRALASGGDKAVRAWAHAEVLDEAARRRWEATDHDSDLEDPARLPLEALMFGYGDERDATLRTAFCQSEARRYLLFEVLGEWGRSTDMALISDFAASPNLSDDEKELLAKVVGRVFARGEADEPGRGGNLEFDWLQAFLRGEKPDWLRMKVTPLRCG